MRIYALLFIALVVIFKLNAQDKQRFEKIFEKETSGESSNPFGKFRNAKNLSYYPDTLPSWFFNPVAHVSGYFAIGISDPDMQWAEAKEQAILRAKALALLQEWCKIQYFRDIYTDAREVQKYTTINERFDSYFKLTSNKKVADNMFSVVDTHFTRYNEYVALIRYSPSEARDEPLYPLVTNATIFFVSASFDGAEDNQAEFEMVNYRQDSNQTFEGAEFTHREKGQKFLILSKYRGNWVEFPVFPYSYATPDAMDRSQVLVSYSGLWSITVRQLLYSLMINTQPYSVRLKNIDQQYSSGLNRLAREIASFESSLKINGIKFVNDTLKFDINLEGQSNSMW